MEDSWQNRKKNNEINYTVNYNYNENFLLETMNLSCKGTMHNNGKKYSQLTIWANTCKIWLAD
jgi:hypothetical protein